jgi:hypothetical protein
MDHICKNCNHHFKGEFCSQCGQKHSVLRFTFAHIFSEAFHAFTHADKGVLILVKKLFTNPGEVAYEYIVECKRKKYFNLFTFFVLVSALSAYVGSLDLGIKEKVFNENNYYGYIFNTYSKLLTLVTIPITGFFIWLLHASKSKLLYSEYTVLAMLLSILQAMADIIVRLTSYCIVLLAKKDVALDGSIIYALFMIGFIAWANYGFHKRLMPAPFLRSIATGIIVMLVQIGIALFTIWAFIRHFEGLGVFRAFGIWFSR